jgi:hypothetical protein
VRARPESLGAKRPDLIGIACGLCVLSSALALMRKAFKAAAPITVRVRF